MTKAQIHSAVHQMMAYLENVKANYDAGTAEYEMHSARSLLYMLGYDTDQANEVIVAIADQGFSYCLDSTVPSNDENGKLIYPSSDVCFWGFDQLLSRLWCIAYGSDYRRIR
jgi:hypothetical protein